MPIKGRGVASNPKGRFEPVEVVWEVPLDQRQAGERLNTEFLVDTSKSVLSKNQSPDIRFEWSLNPYRGCEHGCTYCYARPSHELLGYSAGLDFETKILVKENAPELLREHLSSARWQPRLIALSGNTDPYQPIERRLRLTRRCLEVLAEFRNPVGIITKNHLVTRDVDLLSELARHQAIEVSVSITTLDAGLTRKMEPRTSHPRKRLQAIRVLTDHGIPCRVLVAPIVPAINDHEIPAILAAAAEAGATYASYILLRLPYGTKELFEEWLSDHFPDRKEKVLSRIRSTRSGKLNDPRFGSRMRGQGAFADQIAQLFEVARRKHGLDRPPPEPSCEAFRRPAGHQLALF